MTNKDKRDTLKILGFGLSLLIVAFISTFNIIMTLVIISTATITATGGLVLSRLGFTNANHDGEA